MCGPRSQADKAALIRSETNEPITAGEYILGRIRSNFKVDEPKTAMAKEVDSKRGHAEVPGEDQDANDAKAAKI